MPLAYWLCLISIFFWLIFVGIVARIKGDYLHPVVVFSLLFVISYPLKLQISFHGFYVLNSMSVDQETILLSILISNVAGLLFVIPMVLQTKTATNQKIFNTISFSTTTTLALAVLLLIASYGLDAFRAIFSLEGLQGRITERAYERVGAGGVALFGQVGLYFIIIFAIKYITESKSKFIGFVIVVGYSVFALLISGSKYNALLLPIIMIIVWHYKNRAAGRRVFNMRRLLIGAMAMLFFVGLTGYIRGVGAWDVESSHPFFLQVIFQLTNAFDAPDNLIVLLDRTDDLFFGSLGLRLLRDNLLFPFIPRFIWPDKPLVQGNQLIMQEYFSERFGGHLGEAISPSFPGEMILTGGLLYMAILLILLGFLCGRVYFLAQTKGGVYFIAYICIVLNIFNFLRSGTGVVGSFVLFLIVAFFMVYFLRMLPAGKKVP